VSEADEREEASEAAEGSPADDAPSAEAPPAAASSAEAAPRKPKRKRKGDIAEEEDAAPITDVRAKEIALAFEAGDFVRVRTLGEALAKEEDARLSAIGRDYLARIAVDPMQLAFLGLCAAALIVIAWIYVPH
jgi:hypothetical protein